MKLEHTVRYAAPPTDVYAMLTDPAFREKASWAQGCTSVEVSVDGAAITIDVQQPTTDLPGFARKIVGESSRVIQAEIWNGTDAADFSATIPGTPGSVIGIRTLTADGSDTLDTFVGEAKAKIPLIGAKLEALVAAKFTDAWDTEREVGVTWLDGER